jgi:hypothetical protein
MKTSKLVTTIHNSVKKPSQNKVRLLRKSEIRSFVKTDFIGLEENRLGIRA